MRRLTLIRWLAVGTVALAICTIPTVLRSPSESSLPPEAARATASSARTTAPAPSRAAPTLRPSPVGDATRLLPVGALALRMDFPSAAGTRSSTADPSIAAGSRAVLVATNDAFTLYDKAGYPLDEVSPTDMFASVLSASGYTGGDPRVIFDQRSLRFFLALVLQRATGPCGSSDCDLRWLLAVSRDEAPASLRPRDWHLYAFDGSIEGGRHTATFGDFVVLGIDERNVVLSGYMSSTSEDTVLYTKVWVLDKAPLLAGQAVSGPQRDFTDIRDPQTGRPVFRLLPATMFGGTGGVFLAGRGTSGCSLVVAAVSGRAAEAELVTRSVLLPGECRPITGMPQPGGGTPLAPSGDVRSPPVYRDGYLWLTHGLSVPRPSGFVGGIRIVQLDMRAWPATPSVVSDLVFAEDGVWYAYPALTVNARQDVAVVMNRSSFSEYGSVYYTGRLASDAAGTLRPPVALKRGEANQNRLIRPSQPEGSTLNPFADFSGAALDPQDGSAWIVGSYVVDVCEWGTWVGRLDWSVVATTLGDTPSVPALRAGPPCPTRRSSLFTLSFMRQEPPTAYPGAPPGTIPYLFGYTGAEIETTPERAPRITSPDERAAWTIPSPGTFVLFLSASFSPGPYNFRIRLPDGRETGAFFTVTPP